MNAKWITVKTNRGNTSLYIFKKSFHLSEKPYEFTVKVSADTRYKLYINGYEICCGPCAGGAFKKYYENIECAYALNKGENVIEVKVIHDPTDSKLITMFRRSKPALYFDGKGLTEDGGFEIVSDESFEAFIEKNIAFEHRHDILWSVGPFENINGEKHLEKLDVETLFYPNVYLKGYTMWGVADRYLLEERPLPIFVPDKKSELSKIREFIDDNGKYNIVFASDVYTTAMLTYEFTAEKDAKIKAVYAECALTRGDDGNLFKGLRDNTDGVIDSTAYDIVTANGKPQTYEPFSYRAFRYIRLECDKKPEHIKILAARYTYDYETNAEGGGVGYFESSDPLHSKMWNISRNTLECCTHETVVDCPFYEQQQYIMDGGLESIFAWRLSNDSSIQRKFLTDMAQSQNCEGLLSANYPNIDLQIIPGFSLYFVMAVREYLRYTDDRDFARSMTGTCDRILEYFARTADDNGLVMPEYGWRYLDWVDGWDRGMPIGVEEAPMTAYNLMYAAALGSAAGVCDVCGRPGLAEDYRKRTVNTICAVNTLCFDKKKGLYTDVYGKSAYSQHTTVWAILSGAVKGNKAKELMERTMNDITISKCSFSMRYYLLRALEASDCYEKYADTVLHGWKTMLDNHCTTWCEDAVTCRSECHGWSCAPMYEMSAMILGITPAENGFKKVRIKPCEMGLTHANGRVPIPNGYIDVSWKREGERFTLDINASTAVAMDIILPSGKALTVETNKFSISE